MPDRASVRSYPALGDYLRTYALFDLVIILLPLRWITGEIVFVVAGAFLCLAYFLGRLNFDRQLSPLDTLFLVVFSGIFLFAIYNAVTTEYRSIYYATVGALSLIAARFLFKDLRHALHLSGFLLIAYFGIFALYGLIYGFDASSIDGFFPNSSRNGVSAIAIFLQVFYSAAHFITRGSLPVATAAITFGISVLCHGRAGILVAGLLLAVSAGRHVFGHPHRAVLGIGAMIMAGIVLYIVPNSIVSDLIAATNFHRRGFESLRFDMIDQYLASLDLRSFLAGVDLSTVPLIAQYNLNPHNSFLRGHAFFGISYLAFLAVLAGVIAKGLLQRQWVLVFLLMLLLARAFVDITAFFDLLDFVPLFIVYLLAHGVRAGNGQRDDNPRLRLVPYSYLWSDEGRRASQAIRRAGSR